MDMRFYWVQYQTRQGHCNVFWKTLATNLDDYLTKHHPPHHHRRMHPVYLFFPGNKNNASARLRNYSQNTSLNERPKKESNKETHLQKNENTHIDVWTHRYLDG